MKKRNKKNRNKSASTKNKAIINKLYSLGISSESKSHIKSFSNDSTRLKNVVSTLPKQFKEMLFSPALPKNFNDLGNGMMSHYTGDIISEFKWFNLYFRTFKNEITKFLEYKAMFDKNFLLGNYKECNRIIDSVEEEICVSYWGIECRFLMKQFSEGLDSNIKLLSSFKNTNPNNPYFPIIIQFLSRKAENELSFFSYKRSLDRMYNDAEIENHWIVDYFKSYLDLFGLEYKNDYRGIFFGEDNSSIIDKYLTYQKLSQYITSCSIGTDSFYSTVFNANKETLQFIDDSILSKNSFLFDKRENFNFSIKTNRLFELWDLFLVGSYDNCIISALQMIKDDPTYLDAYIIYIKSLIHDKKELNKITECDSHVDKICKYLFEYYNNTENSQESLIEIGNLSYKLSSFEISHQLFGFFINDLNENNYNHYILNSYLSSKEISPKIIEMFVKKDPFLQLTDKLLNQYDSQSINLWKDLYYKSDATCLDTNNLPNTRKMIFECIALVYNKKYDKIIQLIETNITELSKIAYYHKIIVTLLFISYFENKQIDKSIDLFVTTYFNNPILIKNINTKDVIHHIESNKFINVSHTINLPIFFKLSNEQIYKQYVAYDLFMRSMKLRYPSEIKIESHFDEESYNKLYFFLQEVCVPKVLSKSVRVFNSTNEVQNERIKICQNLLQTKENDKLSKEIEDITKRLTIKQRINEIDQSKIYVDEDGILSYDLDEFKKEFSRYKIYIEILDKNKLDFLSYVNSVSDFIEKKHEKINYEKKINSEELQFLLFKNLYLELRDKFLFSNRYGLDAYLSQRIRHGTIIGQMRKQFQESKIITEKNKKSEYTDNSYWNRNIIFENELQKTSFNNIMNKFSKDVDSMIYKVKNKYIQIVTENTEDSNGWFKFTYSKEIDDANLFAEFLSKYKLIDNLEDFVHNVFESFWNMTEYNLNYIRVYINRDIAHYFHSILLDLENELRQLDIKNTIIPLLTKVIECRTNFPKDLEKIMQWFQRSKTIAVDFKIEDAIDTSIAIIDNLESNISLNVVKELDYNQLINGVYFTHFVDLFKILLSNIVVYSKLNTDIIADANISIKMVCNQLICCIKNPILPKTDIEMLDKTISVKCKEIDEFKDTINIRNEGNTGLIKATNILKNIFHNPSNRITIEIEDKKNILVKFNVFWRT